MLNTDNDGDGYGDSYKFVIMLNTDNDGDCDSYKFVTVLIENTKQWFVFVSYV